MNIHSPCALVIDAEPYLYTAAAGAEWEAEWEPDRWTFFCDHAKARDTFAKAIDDIKKLAPRRCRETLLTFGARSNFRYLLLPSYKGHRRKTRKPCGYRSLVEWASHTWPSYLLDNVEGDDTTGLVAIPERGDVIASTDKDLLTVPGFHLRDGQVVEVSELEADRKFLTQALSGDSADGYKGCPGLGEVRAARLMEACDSLEMMWQVVALTYMKAGLLEADALVQARCARILRPGEYDLETGRPQLWSPPSPRP